LGINLENAEPAVSRSSIDFSFEDAKGIVAISVAVIILSIIFLLMFDQENPNLPTINMALSTTLLLIPPMIYIFSFWAYRQILFNEQVQFALKLYRNNESYRNQIKQKAKEKLEALQPAFRNSCEKGLTCKIRMSFWGNKKKIQFMLTKDSSFPPDTISQELRNQIDADASRAVTSYYGVSLSAYFPVLIILEIIVILGFAVPLHELLSSGNIGTINIALWPGTIRLNSWVPEWAFFGAFVHSFYNMMDRVPRKDIRPSFYLNILTRYLLAVSIASIMYLGYDLFVASNNISSAPMALFAGIAFIIGMFPNVFLRTTTDGIAKKLHVSLSADVPLTDLPGISRMETSRLWEEGIHNISQLSNVSVEDLHKRTHYDERRLSTIIGSAILWRAIGGDKILSASEMTRMEALRLTGLTTIQDLNTFIFAKPDDNNQHNDKNLALIATKLDLDKAFVLNAAEQYYKVQEQIKAQKPIEKIAKLNASGVNAS
jgi:hypothetical protein